MEELTLIFRCICLGWLLTSVEIRPTLRAIRNILLKKQQLVKILTNTKVFTCLKCVTFWLTLAYTHDIMSAAVASFLANLIDNKLLNTTNL